VLTFCHKSVIDLPVIVRQGCWQFFPKRNLRVAEKQRPPNHEAMNDAARRCHGFFVLALNPTLGKTQMKQRNNKTHSEKPMTPRQMAAHLSITEWTLAKYRREGLIPFLRINCRTFRYVASDVKDALMA
jgi:hypothetical protein